MMLRMDGASKRSTCSNFSIYRTLQNLHWSEKPVVSVVFILLIVAGLETFVDCSFMHESRAVVDDFYSRYDTTTPVDLVFVLDRSESVSRQGWTSMINFVKNILDPFPVDQDYVCVAMVTFSSTVTTEFNYLEQDSSINRAMKCRVYNQMRDLISNVGLSGHAATYDAFSKALEILQNARPAAKKAVILVTDSSSNVGEHPRKMSLNIQALDWGQNWNSSVFGPQVEIYAFGIASATSEFLQSVASALPHHYSYFSDFNAFNQFTRSIRKDNVEDQWIDADVSNCVQSCSQQNSKCMCGRKTGQFSCACKPGFELDESVCRACHQGYYKEGYIPERCRRCPQNSTTSAVGTTNSSSCHPFPGHQRCSDLPSIEHGYKFYVSGDNLEEVANTGIDCKDVRDGNSCHYECETGYRLTNGSKIMKCNAWGKWEGETPYCKIVDCEQIPESWANSSRVDLTYANGTTSYGSVILASCWPGLVAFGPTAWTCGESTIWKGQSNFQCREVHCGALRPIDFADMVPPDCATVKKTLGYECQMICREGFQHLGPGNFTCSFEGGTLWKPRVGEVGESKCHDILGPSIDCPPNITVTPTAWENCTVINYHEQQPRIHDNSGSARFGIIGEPKNSTFCVGHTVLIYEAKDKTGNTKKCERTITVIEKNVEIVHCPSNIVMPVNSSSRSHSVSWTDPIFHGRNGDVLPFTCSPASGKTFIFGSHNVVCYPIKYPSSKCEFTVDIPESPCLLPFPDRQPVNGHIECDNNTASYSKKCSIKCNDGYERFVPEPTNFFCNWDGSWTLNTPWPQCYRSRRSNHFQADHSLTVELDGSSCEEKRAKIIDSFIQKVERILDDKSGPCRSPYECSIRSVSFSCTERSRSKRSEDSLANLTSVSFDLSMQAESTLSRFYLKFVIIVKLDSVSLSSVTKSNQTKIVQVLDAIYYNMSDTIEASQFTWKADDLLISAVAMEIYNETFVDLDCAADEISEVEKGTAACFSCPAGTYYEDGTCNLCPIGSFKDYEGGKICKPCQNGKNTTTKGARNASECLEPCPAGYSSSTGYDLCTPCRVGTFQNEIKSKFCHQCSENQTTWGNESTSIDDCYELVSCVAYNKSCGSNGSCILRQGDLQCQCILGFTGSECEINIDECEHSLCQNNGTCVDQINGYKCQCSPSFSGERCELEVDECSPSPCFNGSSCIDNFLSYNCLCQQGFTGSLCESDINECASNPCRFGNCSDGENSFTCSCHDGYTGYVCERQIDFCINITCHNGGICNGSSTGTSCSCLTGYTGANCESKVNACASNPCQNNGTCTNHGISFLCWCPFGFIGDTCALGVSSDFDLVFSESSVTNYVKLRLKLDASLSLRQVTVCTWMRSSDVQNYGTIWSYAADNNWLTADNSNVLTAIDYGNLKIFVNGEVAATNVSLNDGNWHHLCFVWSGEDGQWMLYINGTRHRQGHNLAKGTYIQSSGILTLGQEQGSLGGGFDSRESFIGELTQFSIFDAVLSETFIAEIASVRSDKCQLAHGNITSWTDVLDSIHGNVTIRNTSWCNDINECRFKDLNNCLNSTRCEDTLGSFNCVKCETANCINPEEISKACARNPCQNNGTCNADVGGYFCECRPDFIGRHCEHKVNRLACDKNPCLNGGTCSSSSEECICVKPWGGRHCQVRSLVTCDAQPCSNNGTCISLDQGYLCKCPLLNVTTGSDCEILSPCASSPCQSGATCVATDGATEYHCECKPGFSGQKCEIASPAVCKNLECINGGTCLMLNGGFKCKCTRDYEGTYCSILRNTEVKAYNVQVKLDEQYHRTLPHNNTFKETFIYQIHQIYELRLDKGRLQVYINSIREGSVLVGFDLIHTYFLDETYAGPEVMKKTLEDELKNGRLGIYKASPEDFIFLTKSESKSSNAAIYISVIVFIVVAVIVTVLAYFFIRRYKTTRISNKPPSPMRVSNPMYHGDFPSAAQTRNNIQDSLYCDPVELLPYATSEDSDKDSDPGTDGLAKKKKKGWHLRQSIPLPPKPDEARGACGHSLAEFNRVTPPPPYSADGHAPIPPAREPPKKSVPSTVQHSYANQSQAAADSFYFMPLSDEEADLPSHLKQDKPVSENPAFEPESAYLIPRRPAESPDATENIEMTYLAPTINDAEVKGDAVAATDNTELCNVSDTMYAIRSMSCESEEASSNMTPLLAK